jgi:hypothetical protein
MAARADRSSVHHAVIDVVRASNEKFPDQLKVEFCLCKLVIVE